MSKQKTSQSSRPIPSWLDYAVTSKARASIHHYLNQQKKKESLRLGRKLLRSALTNQGYRRPRISSSDKVNLLKHLGLDDWEQLMIDIGFGRRLPRLVAKQLIAESAAQHHPELPAHKRPGLTIRGTERLLITYANCCNPVPGDKIIGTTTSGRGLVVHRSTCKNSKIIFRHPDNLFHLNWSDDTIGQIPGADKHRSERFARCTCQGEQYHCPIQFQYKQCLSGSKTSPYILHDIHY